MDGVVKFFYHSPSSRLPVPDVLGETTNPKTEYHPLPDGRFAENWVKECQQRTIRKLATGSFAAGRHLFWVTSSNDRETDLYRVQFVVGYLSVDEMVERPTIKDGREIRTHTALVGTPVLVRFGDALPTKEVLGGSYNRPRFIHDPYVAEGVGRELRSHFDAKENIAALCAHEIGLLRERLARG